MDLINVEALTFQNRTKSMWSKSKVTFDLGPVSFNVKSGETLAIVGNNSSGKSLLAKLLVGLETPKSGKIFMNGVELNKSNISVRCHDIRMIFQNSNDSLNPGLTLGSILEEPLRLNTKLNGQQRRSLIEQTLRQVGLMAEHQFFYRHMLSDGQRQRIALARALILNPKVIVADEPFAALDPSVRSQAVNLLMKLQRDLGLGFIFISHNLGIVRHISDKVIIMKDGKVVESGKTDAIFNWPKNEYTKKLVDSHQALINGQNNQR
ncbi:ATP-binding cassette domain-containing protein [Paraglaciecola sp. MB-3u-78]|jgi:cationic peptide transport system ATP-binding protein|uniref:peptide ABC transporter ATP-binding protein n=1 Tax=Paraglaciecola sp. MB-3u-78 TaxID=2058332 RepID=UPI000C33A634|nr:ATP-binding cassette domain-containing protein [Paraglaciecola sp. MB-3u-78]PKH00772.1 peptide ABC transporter ATP-binding protein [Paraglaciecola sp. MB-3u-78]